jgi:hypothetical protein
MPETQNVNIQNNHIEAINTYNVYNKYVFENVCINEFFDIPISDASLGTIDTIGSDICKYDILKGNSGCNHLPKYIVAVEDTMDHNMLSIHTSYDYCMRVSFDSNSYVIYERITDCIICG